MKRQEKLRRSGIVIMAKLIALLGSLAYIMVLAVINGSVGFLCAMGVTLSGAVGVAKALGASPAAANPPCSSCCFASGRRTAVQSIIMGQILTVWKPTVSCVM